MGDPINFIETVVSNYFGGPLDDKGMVIRENYFYSVLGPSKRLLFSLLIYNVIHLTPEEMKERYFSKSVIQI